MVGGAVELLSIVTLVPAIVRTRDNQKTAVWQISALGQSVCIGVDDLPVRLFTTFSVAVNASRSTAGVLASQAVIPAKESGDTRWLVRHCDANVVDHSISVLPQPWSAAQPFEFHGPERKYGTT